MMENPRPEKVAIVDELKRRLGESSAVLISEYRGLKVSELEALRKELRSKGAEIKVFKNTLVRIAARESGHEVIEPLLEGPTALTFVSDDAAVIAKSLREFARTQPALVIKGGLLGGKRLGVDETLALADLPSRDVLLSKIAGGFAAPLQNFAGLVKALPQNMAYALAALVEKRQGDSTAA
jgi:large subunit ribosomal protein L10